MTSSLPRALRQAYSGVRSILLYPRSCRIVSRYHHHYREAQQSFASDGAHPLVARLTEVGVRVWRPGDRDWPFGEADRYLELVGRVAACASDRLALARECLFYPPADASTATLTAEVPAVRRGEVIAVQLRRYLDVDGLQELCDLLMPTLERLVYRARVVVDKVYIYRNLVSARQHGDVSWLWHFDNHPDEILKVMVYLTDVGERDGPFEYLRSLTSQEALHVPARPLRGYGRFSEGFIARRLREGYECCKVQGPRGTLLLFDNNVVHRANIARGRHRDVVVLQLRPCTFRPDRYIDARWTGSFHHVDFSPDPYDHRPRPKRRMLSA